MNQTVKAQLNILKRGVAWGIPLLFLLGMGAWLGQAALWESFFPGGVSPAGLFLASLSILIATLLYQPGPPFPFLSNPRWWQGFIRYAAVMVLLVGLSRLLQWLMLGAREPLALDNLFRMGSSGLAVLCSLIFLLIAFFRISFPLVYQAVIAFPRSINRLQFVLLSAGLGLPLSLLIGLDLSLLGIFFLILVALLLLDLFTEGYSTSLTWSLIWLIMLSAFMTILLYRFSIERDFRAMEQIAPRLAAAQDTVAMQAIRELPAQLDRSDSLQQLLQNTTYEPVSSVRLQQQLDVELSYFPYLRKYYRCTPLVFNSSGRAGLRQQPQLSPGWLAEAVPEARTPVLRSLPGGQLAYLLRVNSPSSGMLYLLFTPQEEGGERLANYLTDKPYRGIPELLRYDFAIASANGLQYYQGRPHFSLLQTLAAPQPGTNTRSLRSSRAAIRYLDPNQGQVLMERPLGGYAKPVAFFAFTFALLFLGYSLFSWIPYLWGVQPSPAFPSLITLGGNSLRQRVQGSVFLLILGSFLVLAAVTTWYFQRSSLGAYESQLVQQVSTLRSDLEQRLLLMPPVYAEDELLSQVYTLADIHQLDVELYDLNGRIQASSTGFLQARSLAANQLPPAQVNSLTKGLLAYVIGEQVIEEQTFRKIIFPVRQVDARPVYYLAGYYPAPAQTVPNALYDFMGALLSGYVFFLLIAGAVAIWVANSITEPLEQLREHLQELRIDQLEPLDWERPDEIGRLVQAYNTALGALADSTERLRQSERESAWREMAKQVAHEIKNPLTPMKLSLQYLQRAAGQHPDRVEQLLPGTLNTLLEQIDSLDRIATEFSHFARMPKAENEHFDLRSIVRAAYDLFGEQATEELHYELELPEMPTPVFADRKQLLRVLNNLLQNAQQAIPSGRRGSIRMHLVSHQPHTWTVEVVDNGSGIPESIRDRVFTPNFTTKSSGMGLGLAMCKAIVEQAGGEITFSTTPDVGTQFAVTLPAVQTAPS